MPTAATTEELRKGLLGRFACFASDAGNGCSSFSRHFVQCSAQVLSGARINPFSPDDWKEHFQVISAEPEGMDDEVREFIEFMPVDEVVRQLSQDL